MKFAHIAVVVVAGSIGFAVAASRQPQTSPPPAAPIAQPAAAPSDLQPDNLRKVLDVFRSDLNASKIRLLNQVMKLTESEAEEFWPIYQKYEADLAAVNDRRVELIRQFIVLQSTDSLTDQNAGELANKWLKFAEDRLNLWKSYNAVIATALSPIRAAQFLQVEHQISLLVDINIASEMPVIATPTK